MKVLILGVTTRAGLSLLRKLAKDGVSVIGADEVLYPWGLHSRYSKKYYHYDASDSVTFIYSLEKILEHEKPDILIPVKNTGELIEHRRRIESHTHLLLPPIESYLAANDNLNTLQECHRLGIPSPRLYCKEEALDLLQQSVDDIGEPRLVVKPRLDIGGARGVYYIKTSNDLNQSIQSVKKDFGDFCIQEYIPGKPQAMYAINLLYNRKSKLLAAFGYRKIRQYPMKGGLSVYSVSIHMNDIITTITPLLMKWKWQGPVDIEYKIDARDNKPKIIEINPRYSGNIGFALDCGVPFHSLHCKAAQGCPVSIVSIDDYTPGIKGGWFYYYIKSLIAERKSGGTLLDIIRHGYHSIHGAQFGIRDNLVDIAPTIGLILKLYLMRKRCD